MAEIKYKGQIKEYTITNKVMMKFEMAGGSFVNFESQPISQSIIFICCALGLEGDPIDHADDFEGLPEIAESIKSALDESGFSNSVELGKTDG